MNERWACENPGAVKILAKYSAPTITTDGSLYVVRSCDIPQMIDELKEHFVMEEMTGSRQ